jgi:hypothetical protein
MAVELDIRAEHRNRDGMLVFNQWWKNFSDTLPRDFSEREQVMKQHGIDTRPKRKPYGDSTFKLRFNREEDITLFLLRFS